MAEHIKPAASRHRGTRRPAPVGRTHRKQGERRAAEPQPPPAPRARVDQFNAILARGLDLAEASLSLGLTMINKVGAVAEQQVFDRMSARPSAGEPSGAAPSPDYGAGTAPGSAFGPGAPDIPVPEEAPQYCITNRQPLAPGGPVRVSFSINNDSMTAPKKVSLHVEGFAGEAEGQRIDPRGFVVKPGTRTIAPMDFEKFVIQGAIPPEAAPDVYRGWVVVSSGQDFRIPIRLVILSP